MSRFAAEDEFRHVLQTLCASQRSDPREQRLAARLGRSTGFDAGARLETADEWLSLRCAAWVLGCSKSSIRQLIAQGMLRSRNAAARRPHFRRDRIPWDSVRNFIRACQHWQQFQRRRPAKRRSNLLSRFLAGATAADLRRIPPKLTIEDTSVLLRCSRTSVVRMIHANQLRAERRTPHRWLVLKQSFR
jgi:hypothetical protein